jgi:hypothetical protein
VFSPYLRCTILLLKEVKIKKKEDEKIEQVADNMQEIKVERKQQDEGEYLKVNQLCPSHFAWT